jgi:hypothetical protein
MTATTSASIIPACRDADAVEAPFEGLEPGAVAVEFPPDIALALKAAKLFDPDSTELTENTMPAAQWEPCRQYAQIGADWKHLLSTRVGNRIVQVERTLLT